MLDRGPATAIREGGNPSCAAPPPGPGTRKARFFDKINTKILGILPMLGSETSVVWAHVTVFEWPKAAFACLNTVIITLATGGSKPGMTFVSYWTLPLAFVTALCTNLVENLRSVYSKRYGYSDIRILFLSCARMYVQQYRNSDPSFNKA